MLFDARHRLLILLAVTASGKREAGSGKLQRGSWKLLAVTALLALCAAARPVARQEPALSVRITSPLGRTGLPGTVRIVAQVQHPQNVLPGQVRFYVDQKLLGTVTDGPPYATEWIDDNPFERREISVEVSDTLGHEAKDKVVLEPFEISEAAEVNSVLIEASVQDKTGRFLKGIPPTQFSVLENDVPQQLDLVRQEAVGATFALMVDSSSSMSRRMDFVQRTAATLSKYMSPLDRMIVAPFSIGRRRGHRADQRSADDPAGHPGDPAVGRYGDSRFDRAGGPQPDQRRGAPRDRADHGRLRRAEHVDVRRRAGRGSSGGRDGLRRRDRRRRRHLDQR